MENSPDSRDDCNGSPALALESFRAGARLLQSGLRALILTQGIALALLLFFVGDMYEIGCDANNLRFLLWLLAGLILALFLPFAGWIHSLAAAGGCAHRGRRFCKRMMIALVLLDLALFALGGIGAVAGMVRGTIVSCPVDNSTSSAYHL
jgi:hypothetical protein